MAIGKLSNEIGDGDIIMNSERAEFRIARMRLRSK